MDTKKQIEPREIAIVDDSMRRENDVEESKEVTEFADQSHEVQVDVPAIVEEVPNPYVFQGLKEFLERPVPLGTFSWPLNAAFGSCLRRFVFPDALFNQSFIWEKLRHFQYFRGGLHFRVKINATLYHYGKLLMVWRPLALGKTTSIYGTAQRAGAYDNIYTLSSYPNIQVSPNSSETQELQASFFLPYQWIDLIAFGTATGVTASWTYQRYLMNLGVLEFWVLTPLQASGAADDPPATVTFYANFVNVELAGYTPLQINYSSQVYNIPTNIPTANSFNWANVVLPVAQSGRITTNDASANKGIWKTTAMPMQIASANVDVPMIPLGTHQNAGSHLVAEGMPSMQEYLQVPHFLARLLVKSSTTAGSLLARIPVTPLVYPQNNDTKFPTRLSFLASLFTFWKGELEYHFQVVCSKFHSFRFRVYWTPYATNTSSLPYVANTVNKVVDVQGETNFSVVVPWLHKSPVMKIDTSADNANGYLMVDLLNPLVYPTTPIPQVTINVWISAKRIYFEKLERWATNNTRRNILAPLPPTTVQEQEEEKKAEEVAKRILKDLPVAQSGAFDPEAEGRRGVIQGSESLPNDVGKIIGEEITDFKSIYSKPSKLAVLSNNNKIWYTPFSLQATTTNGVRVVNSFLEYLQLIFVGFSGAVEFWVPQLCDLIANPWSSESYAYSITSTSETLPSLLQDYSHVNLAYFEDVGNGVITHRAVALPFYSTLLFKPFMIYNSIVANDSSVGFPGIDLFIRDAVDTNTYILQRGGGDFSYHFAVGPPMLQ